MRSSLDWLTAALGELDAAGLRRRLRHHAGPPGPWLELESDRGIRRVLHLCGNAYLGLATDPRVTGAAAEAAERYGTGAGASRLVTGGQHLHRRLEDQLADWKGTEDAVLTSSGYLANLAVLTSLAGRGDTIVSDELNHASIVDACRLSGAEVRVYAHADPDHAERQLADAPGRRLLVTDGVFSMDGDLAPLPELCDAAERHGAAVVVDDAHGSGVLGPDGRGTAAHLGCEDRVDAVVATLSKALGSTGGYVAGDARLVEWLRNRARPVIFDTALAAPAVAAASAALDIVRREPQRRERARALARRLAGDLRRSGVAVEPPEACILPLVVGGNEAALAAQRALLDRGVLVVAIRPPSVPAGTARLRATVMATHTDADVDLAASALADVLGASAA